MYMFLSVLRRVQGTPYETGQLETALRDSDPAVQSTAAALAGDVVQTISVPQLRSLATHHLSQVPAPKSRMDLEFACCLQASITYSGREYRPISTRRVSRFIRCGSLQLLCESPPYPL